MYIYRILYPSGLIREKIPEKALEGKDEYTFCILFFCAD